MRARSIAPRLFASLVAAYLSGCEDDPPPAPPPAATPAATPSANGTGPGTTGTGPGQNTRNSNDPPAPPPMPITDQTFSESGMVRDPFRSFARDFVTGLTSTLPDTREVKLPRYSLDDLRLVAVVLGTDSPYAMVIDPSRTGTILRRGMYVGRQEVIHSNVEGGQDYAVHWRVARISPARLRRLADGSLEEVPAELVFERPDPLNPTAQVVERSLALMSTTGGASSAPVISNQGSTAGLLGPGGSAGGSSPGFLPPSLGGLGGGSGGGANGALAATRQSVQQSVGGGSNREPPPQTTTTTVVVQVPPQPAAQAVQPSHEPPPVNITGGGGPLR